MHNFTHDDQSTVHRAAGVSDRSQPSDKSLIKYQKWHHQWWQEAKNVIEPPIWPVQKVWINQSEKSIFKKISFKIALFINLCLFLTLGTHSLFNQILLWIGYCKAAMEGGFFNLFVFSQRNKLLIIILYIYIYLYLYNITSIMLFLKKKRINGCDPPGGSVSQSLDV